MAEDNTNINNLNLVNPTNVDFKDSDPIVDPNNTQGPINPLLNLPNTTLQQNEPVINSVEVPSKIKT